MNSHPRTFLQRVDHLRIYLIQTEQKSLLKRLMLRLDFLAKRNFKFDALDKSCVYDIMKEMK